MSLFSRYMSVKVFQFQMLSRVKKKGGFKMPLYENERKEKKKKPLLLTLESIAVVEGLVQIHLVHVRNYVINKVHPSLFRTQPRAGFEPAPPNARTRRTSFILIVAFVIPVLQQFCLHPEPVFATDRRRSDAPKV